MQFDFKITTWQRVIVSEENENKVLNAIKSGDLNTASDVFNFLAELGDHNVSIENLFETETEMSLEENKGYSTISVIDEQGQSVFENGKH